MSHTGSWSINDMLHVLSPNVCSNLPFWQHRETSPWPANWPCHLSLVGTLKKLEVLPHTVGVHSKLNTWQARVQVSFKRDPQIFSSTSSFKFLLLIRFLSQYQNLKAWSLSSKKVIVQWGGSRKVGDTDRSLRQEGKGMEREFLCREVNPAVEYPGEESSVYSTNQV